MNTIDHLIVLMELAQKARSSHSTSELGYLLVNETHQLCSYHQALLWSASHGITHCSGVLDPQPASDYIRWVDASLLALQPKLKTRCGVMNPKQLPSGLANRWEQWWPEHVFWITLHTYEDHSLYNEVVQEDWFLIFTCETPFSPSERYFLTQWIQSATFVWRKLDLPGQQFNQWLRHMRQLWRRVLPKIRVNYP